MILNNQLYSGINGGAGEFGDIFYVDKTYGDYCCGKFFELNGTDGLSTYKRALTEDADAVHLFEDYGTHLAHLLATICYTLDPEVIVVGGSVSKAWKFYEKKMFETLKTLLRSEQFENLTVVPTSMKESGVLGAASLCLK